MEIRKFQKRQIAHKIAVEEVINSRYMGTDDLNPNYIEIGGRGISRVNIIGIVIQKSEIINYKNLVVDDGTGKLSARVFEDNISLDKIDVGDFVLIIGRPREFSNEKYLLIETIKKVDASWAKVRKLELTEYIGNNGVNSSVERIKDKGVYVESSKNKILSLIKDLDNGEGVSADDILVDNIVDIDKIVSILLKEGDIFEIKPGKLKVLE